MNPAQCIQTALQEGPKPRMELIRAVTRACPDATEAGVDWLLHMLVREGACCRLRRGVYGLGRGKGQWFPNLSDGAYYALCALYEADINTPVALWETRLYEEFGADAGQNLIFAETRGDLEAAFRLLQRHTPHPVLLNPTQKELCLYGESTTFIVKKLVSGAPMGFSNLPRVRLEKLLADLWGERLLRDRFTEAQRLSVFRRAQDAYKVDLVTLRRYGRRRGGLPDFTEVEP